jgi:hypothetical protein
MASDVQLHHVRVGCVAFAWVIGVAGAIAWYLLDPESGAANPALRNTAVLGVLFWAFGGSEMLRLRTREWHGGSDRRAAAQAGWVAGWLMLLVHVAAAFHLAHGWSHTTAYEHTERTAGVGEGIYVNYLFGLVWGVDAVWLAGFPGSYARRPRWVGWAIHGFLAFVVFNATVVYGSGLTRWIGVAAFATLGWCWVRRDL